MKALQTAKYQHIYENEIDCNNCHDSWFLPLPKPSVKMINILKKRGKHK
jgi:hypothetical protein